MIEQGRVGEIWRSQRWDSFTLNTLNWRTLPTPGLYFLGLQWLDNSNTHTHSETLLSLALIRLANAASQLPCGSGET